MSGHLLQCACFAWRLYDWFALRVQVFAASWVEDEVQKSFTLTPFRSPAIANVRGACPHMLVVSQAFYCVVPACCLGACITILRVPCSALQNLSRTPETPALRFRVSHADSGVAPLCIFGRTDPALPDAAEPGPRHSPACLVDTHADA